MPAILRIFVIGLVVVFSVNNAMARERIHTFLSDIVVQSDGSLLVTETIKVRSERRQIRRGIFRSFPVQYRDKQGYWRRVGFKVLSVKRDGKPDNWFLKTSDDYTLLYIGKKEYFLPSGPHTFEITYKTTRQLRYFKQFDELYWNVTGDKWSFPIDYARAVVKLPDGAIIKQSNGFTGRFGAKDDNFSINQISDNKISFETLRKMPPRHGLTIAVGWQKGIVPVPSAFSKKMFFLWDNSGLVALVLGGFFSFLFFLSTWVKRGRDPKKGVIIPLFSAPEGLSPAAVSYIHYRELKNKGSNASVAFIAALVSLAVKGWLEIDNNGKKLVLRRLQPPDNKLPLGEKAIFKKLLGSRKKIVFKESTAATVSAARTNFRTAIMEEHGNIYFHNNIGYFIIGLVISLAALFAFAFLYLRVEYELIPVVLFILACAVCFGLLFEGYFLLTGNVPGGGSKIVGLVFFAASLAIGYAVYVYGPKFLTLPMWILVVLAAVTGFNIAFYWLLHAPTSAGRQIMDQIEGFKLYLSVAEEGRLNMKGAPEVTPQVFEKFLPYAIALGVEKPWSQALESHLARVKITDHEYNYRPHWYSSNTGWSTRDFNAATAGIVSGVAAGMAAATPPASSGSSSGGGFSGGGGGGGGGGGW